MPETHSFVSLLTRMAITRTSGSSRRESEPPGEFLPKDVSAQRESSGELHDLLRGAQHGRLRVHVREVGLGEQRAALLVVGAVEADHERHGRLDLVERL